MKAAIPSPYSAGSTEPRVSNLELFFDLVFVFTITQLTSLLLRDPTLGGLLQMVLLFGNVWWMYGGYAWLTNAVPPRGLVVRLLLLVGMGGFLLIALSIPTAFGIGGAAFGIGFLAWLAAEHCIGDRPPGAVQSHHGSAPAGRWIYERWRSDETRAASISTRGRSA